MEGLSNHDNVCACVCVFHSYKTKTKQNKTMLHNVNKPRKRTEWKSQTQKAMYCMILFMCNVWDRQIHRLVVARGWRGGDNELEMTANEHGSFLFRVIKIFWN